MEVAEQISKFQEFLEMHYHAKLLEIARLGQKFIEIDFEELSKFSPELVDDLIEYPEETIKAFELSCSNFDLPNETKEIRIRIFNLTAEQRILIRNIRSTHIGKLIWFEGVVRQKSDVRPQVTSARFECPSCGNIITVLQLDTKFKEPTRCGCGRKGKFRLLTKELVDAQGLVLEESTKDLDGGEQPKRINVFLKNDLVSPISEKRTNPGSSVRLSGIIKEVPIILKSGGQSTKFDLIVEANHVEAIQEDYTNINISEEEEKKIRELSQDLKLMEKLTQALAPGIFGHDRIKEALLMQFAGGVTKTRDDGVKTRGDIHVLLIGDPGSGKSQLLKRASVVAPKSRYVSGKGTSGAGLTASELDKMSDDDRSAMHEALEQQTVSISKANIQATLRCETTVLAAANPKFGRFDPYENIAKQIDLPPALINRFDLIFTIKDVPNEERDERMAKFILTMHKEKLTEEPEIPTDLLRKYLIYTRQKISPILTDAALDELKEYYVKIRSTGTSEESAIKSVPISPRQLEALIRLSEASAKLRLSDKITKKDAKKAIAILMYCLEQVGLDPETGKIDIDKITSGITSSERSKIIIVKEIINELEVKFGKMIPIEEIVKTAAEKNIDADKVEETIEKLKRTGDLFEPKPGKVQKI